MDWILLLTDILVQSWPTYTVKPSIRPMLSQSYQLIQ